MTNRYSLYVLLAGLSLFTWSCKGFEGATVKVTPNPLEVHADSVRFNVRAAIPPKSGIKKKTQYTGKLFVKSPAGSFEFGSVQANSVAFPDIVKNGAQITQNAQKPYQDGMYGGMLTLGGSYTKGKKEVALPEMELAPCCITTSRLVLDEDRYIFSLNTYVQRSPVTLEARLVFPQNVSDIQGSELDKPEVTALAGFMDKRYEASRVSLEGYASPEGKFKRNRTLSNERAKNTRSYLDTMFKKKGYKNYLDSTFYAVRNTVEDWEGFKANLDRTSYAEDIKRQIIEILASSLDADVKEKKVMSLVGGVREVEFILAPLRRASLRLEGFSASRTDEQIDQLAADFLNARISGDDLGKLYQQEEYLYAIARIKGNANKKRLLTEYAKLYPSDHRVYNDLGVVSLMEGNADQALDLLNKAASIKGNDYAVLNNIGVAFKVKKNYTEALVKLRESYAAKNTPEAAFNIGVILEKRAQYSDASDFFDAASKLPGGYYNAGLCKLLQGDFAGAKSDLENANRENPDRALNYYLLAIVGARSSDSNLLLLNLKRACQIDNTLVSKANGDLEFRNYKTSAEFKSAVAPN
jgi:tetratricopeptide (TPR) repeat protein